MVELCIRSGVHYRYWAGELKTQEISFRDQELIRSLTNLYPVQSRVYRRPLRPREKCVPYKQL